MNAPDEILSFDIEGKFAHFRKFFANNTAFSYSIPPRTTIAGMLAAILGIQKDSYYKTFHSDNIRLGVNVINPIKKSFHRLNYLKIVNKDDFGGAKGHIQLPFEVVSGQDPKHDFVRYRIFIAAGTGKELYNTIKNALQNKIIHYNITLGPANFSARIYEPVIWNVKVRQLDNEPVRLHSTGISSNIKKVFFEKKAAPSTLFIEEELMPADFKNELREVEKMNRIVFSTSGLPLEVNLTGTIYELQNGNHKINIQFLE